MKNKNQFCSTCYFFLLNGSDTNKSEIGYCRANPPYPYFSADGKPLPGRFPIVIGNMWCGAWDAQDDENGKPK